jgi:hypothetical protein
MQYWKEKMSHQTLKRIGHTGQTARKLISQRISQLRNGTFSGAMAGNYPFYFRA